MSTKKIERKYWKPFFDLFSQVYVGPDRETIADLVIETGTGETHTEIRSLPLLGMRYDVRDDVLDVAVESLDHLIYHPREVWITEDRDAGIREVEILDAGGARQIIRPCTRSNGAR